MRGFFKINRNSWGQVRRKLINDIGERIRDDMKEEFKLLPDYYYDCSDKVDSIVYDCSAKVVGSEEWAVAASDTGQDWTWTTEPPFEKIKEWLIKHKGLDPKDPTLYIQVKQKQKDILNYGIPSSFWVDLYLGDFVNTAGDKGSGIV